MNTNLKEFVVHNCNMTFTGYFFMLNVCIKVSLSQKTCLYGATQGFASRHCSSCLTCVWLIPTKIVALPESLMEKEVGLG